jgi:hypothetical protein
LIDWLISHCLTSRKQYFTYIRYENKFTYQISVSCKSKGCIWMGRFAGGRGGVRLLQELEDKSDRSGTFCLAICHQRPLLSHCPLWFDFFVWRHFQQYFSYIMATSFIGGRSRSTRRKTPTMDKQLVNFITCGCESSAPFL